MTNATELMKKRDELNVQIAAALKNERTADLIDVRAKIKLHSFTMTELRSVIKVRKRKAKANTDA